MFPQFAYTAATFSRATALLTRVGMDAQYYDEPDAPNLAILLDSKYEAEKSEGMKRLIALMSQGRDVSEFFPQVVKNVVSPSLELKKLVYIYLVHYAEKRPDEALLAINSFQKDLSDLNPLVRAWSLRAMSGIRVRVVLPLVVMAVSKCARDPSPYVRRCAAHAIPKIFTLDREQHLETLEELICLLMNDNSPGVIGAVAAAFNVVCPDQLFLLGSHYQKLCELVTHVDEWGQVVLIDILLRYAVGRYGFPKGSIGLSCFQKKATTLDNEDLETVDGKIQETSEVVDGQSLIRDCHRDKVEEGIGISAERASPGLQTTTESWLSEKTNEIHDNVCPGIKLLLENTSPLLLSHNSAVVMAAASVHWLLGLNIDAKKTIQPLLFLLRSSFESQYVVLMNIATFVKMSPALFEAYYEDFYITSADTDQIRVLKLDILCLLASESSIHHILQEFQAYVRNPDRQFAADTVSAIGRCAVLLPAVAKSCTDGLLLLARSGITSSSDKSDGNQEEEQQKGNLSRHIPGKPITKKSNKDKVSREDVVVTQAVLALRMIVQRRPLENEEVLARLVRSLDHLSVPKARAIVIWMLGEFGTTGTTVPQMVPVVLQYLGGTFTKEEDETKLQILNCVAKVVLRSHTSVDSSSSTALLIFDYILRLAAYDLNYDIRDRARMLRQLLVLHLKNLPQQENIRSTRDIADRLLQLQVQDSRSGVVASGENGSGEGDSQIALNLSSSKSADGKLENEDESIEFMRLAEHIFLVPKTAPVVTSLMPDRSAYLPGSMSHIVHHKAPNYMPLPEPFSMSSGTSASRGRNRRVLQAGIDQDSSSNVEYSGTGSDEGQLSERQSGSESYSTEENGEILSGHTATSSTEDEQYGAARSQRGTTKSKRQPSDHGFGHQTIQHGIPSTGWGPLISLSDTDAEIISKSKHHDDRQQQLPSNSSTAELGLISSAELDSWLGSSEQIKDQPLLGTVPGHATISIGKVVIKPRIHTLLDFTNGGGLDVKYCFEHSAPMASEGLVYLKVYFQNRGPEHLSGISVKDVESGQVSSESGELETSSIESPVMASNQEVSELDPGGKTEGKLILRFRHRLNPIKLSVLCNGVSYPVKLMPEVGAFMRPVLLSPEAFTLAQVRITGLHEASRRCMLRIPRFQGSGSAFDSAGEDQILLVARTVAERVLSCADVALISTVIPIGDSLLGEEAIKSGGVEGLCLSFSGEIFTESYLCLIVVTIIGQSNDAKDPTHLETLVKINCENTVFGLTLLQELSKALQSPE